MTYTPIAQEYEPIIYLEGVRYPVTKVISIFKANGKSLIQLQIPGDPEMWPKVEIQDEDGEEQSNGLDVVASSNLQGIQPRTLVHVFVKNKTTGEETFLTEGRITRTILTSDKQGTTIVVVAYGSVFFIEEVGVYMADLARSMGVSKGAEWDGRQGTATTSNIQDILEEHGLNKGLTRLLVDAGINTSQATALTWVLLRLAQRIRIVDNPEAWGNINETPLKDILDKTIGEVSTRQPIAAIIMAVLRFIRYLILNVPAPSFINAGYVGDSNDIMDLEIDNSDELQMNDFIISPQIPLSPPPRCNVIFPIDYGALTVAYNWEKQPTRGITRLTGSAALEGNEDSDSSFKYPEIYAEMSTNDEFGRYYTMAEEKYRGIHLSVFNQDRPEYVDDMGSDYIKGYMEQSFLARSFSGQVQFLQPAQTCPLNLKPIPGLPALILQKNGEHILAHLDSIKHTIDYNSGCHTEYGLSLPRSYTTPTPDANSSFFFEEERFQPQNIGAYIYPDIIGGYYGMDGSFPVVDSSEPEDLSILKHLNPVGTGESVGSIHKHPEGEHETLYQMSYQTGIELELITEDDLIGMEFDLTYSEALSLGITTLDDVVAAYMELKFPHLDSSTPVATHGENIISLARREMGPLLGKFTITEVTPALLEKEYAVTLTDDSTPTRTYLETHYPIVNLVQTEALTLDELEALKESDTAIKDAVDALWEEYKNAPSALYSKAYGKRVSITRKHLFENFYDAVASTDYNVVTGGYVLETNSISLVGTGILSFGTEPRADIYINGMLYTGNSYSIEQPIGTYTIEFKQPVGYGEGDWRYWEPEALRGEEGEGLEDKSYDVELGAEERIHITYEEGPGAPEEAGEGLSGIPLGETMDEPDIDSGDSLEEIIEKMPKPRGCFVLERQECYLKPAARLLLGGNVARHMEGLGEDYVNQTVEGSTELEQYQEELTVLEEEEE